MRSFKFELNPQKIPSFVVSFFKKIPKFVWGTCAIIGGVFIGLVVGIGTGYEMVMGEVEPTEMQNLRNKNDEYIKLIGSYHDLISLYDDQMQDVEVFTDLNLLTEHPEEFYQALDSFYDKKNKILFMYGRIAEMELNTDLDFNTIKDL